MKHLAKVLIPVVSAVYVSLFFSRCHVTLSSPSEPETAKVSFNCLIRQSENLSWLDNGKCVNVKTFGHLLIRWK